MKHSFFETINKASDALPHLDFNNENINYLSHYHEEFELIYISRGNLQLQLGQTSFSLSKGDIALVMPGEIHSFCSTESNKLYIMKFYAPAGWNLGNIQFRQCVIPPRHPAYGILYAEICHIHDEFLKKETGYQLAIQRHLLQILLVFLRKIGYDFIDMQADMQNNAKINFLNTVQAYIKNHYKEHITLDSIAAYCQYSKYHFSHYFKAVTGKSFLEYVALYRVEQAMRLIGAHGHSMTEISELAGFSSVRSFNRTFKKYTGQAPLEYRRKNS